MRPFLRVTAAIGGCRHAVICPITIRQSVKKSLAPLTGYYGQQYEIVHHVTCNIKPCARLDFVQSGVFAFDAIFILAFQKKSKNRKCVGVLVFLLLGTYKPVSKNLQESGSIFTKAPCPRRGSGERDKPLSIPKRKGGEQSGVYFFSGTYRAPVRRFLQNRVEVQGARYSQGHCKIGGS